MRGPDCSRWYDAAMPESFNALAHVRMWPACRALRERNPMRGKARRRSLAARRAAVVQCLFPAAAATINELA
nr:hypothetical protein OG781_15215 [Streptomyces sp. NBC_00830]